MEGPNKDRRWNYATKPLTDIMFVWSVRPRSPPETPFNRRWLDSNQMDTLRDTLTRDQRCWNSVWPKDRLELLY